MQQTILGPCKYIVGDYKYIHMLISFIIPTRNSQQVLPLCLDSIRKQTVPNNVYEILVVDNESTDSTRFIAETNEVRFFSIPGKPSQACTQRNIGAQNAMGKYLFFLDHDMELEPELLQTFQNNALKKRDSIDAWYIPEKIKSSSKIFEKVRNFERSFYNGTFIDAARIIKKDVFDTTQKYDVSLSAGPADWDMDIQLSLAGAKFAMLNSYIIHHEEALSIHNYFAKKKFYKTGIEQYKQKWKQKDAQIYVKVIQKQLGIQYRFFTVFFENGKYKRILHNPILFGMLIVMKLVIACQYFFSKRR